MNIQVDDQDDSQVLIILPRAHLKYLRRALNVAITQFDQCSDYELPYELSINLVELIRELK